MFQGEGGSKRLMRRRCRCGGMEETRRVPLTSKIWLRGRDFDRVGPVGEELVTLGNAAGGFKGKVSGVRRFTQPFKTEKIQGRAITGLLRGGIGF